VRIGEEALDRHTHVFHLVPEHSLADKADEVVQRVQVEPRRKVMVRPRGAEGV
jgi:hypothetical protein